MSDKSVKDYVSAETSAEAKVRAARIGITKMKLYSLVALIPYKELESLTDKYLTRKKHPSLH